MSKHEQYEELCTLAMIGEVSPTEIEDLRHHLGECAACREQYREFTEFLLPQLSLASEKEGAASRECTEAERHRLRGDFLLRAQEKGFEFSKSALSGSEAKEPSVLRPAVRHSRIFWNWALGGSLAGCIFAGGYFTHREIEKNQPTKMESLTHSGSGAQTSPASSAAAPSRAIEGRDQKTIADLEQKLGQTAAELSTTQQALKQTQIDQASLTAELEEKNRQMGALQSQVQGDTQSAAELRSQAADLKRRIDESQSTIAANELHMRDLNDQLSNQTTSLDREREMLSVGRDVRDLMGARSLHIIDVHDSNGVGKNQKSFGRIFYTEGKSLIFYAFDLDDKRVVNANYSYQAWGERLGQPASVKSLGMLYVDDKAQRRWSLKVDDPRQLSEINSVFVTLEPRTNDGDKPRGKRILFAFLGGEANHP